jgi:hypothetical protein
VRTLYCCSLCAAGCAVATAIQIVISSFLPVDLLQLEVDTKHFHFPSSVIDTLVAFLHITLLVLSVTPQLVCPYWQKAGNPPPPQNLFSSEPGSCSYSRLGTSFTRGPVCLLSIVLVIVNYIFVNMRGPSEWNATCNDTHIYNTYKASVSPRCASDIMPYLVQLLLRITAG